MANSLPPPPLREPITSTDGLVTQAWVKFFTLLLSRIGGSGSSSIVDISGYLEDTIVQLAAEFGRTRPDMRIDALIDEVTYPHPRSSEIRDESAVYANMPRAPLTGKTLVLSATGNAQPVADNTYTVGIGTTTNGTITTVNGIITAVTQAS